MVQSKKFVSKSYYLCITNIEIVQNSNSKPKKFSFLCTFKDADSADFSIRYEPTITVTNIIFFYSITTLYIFYSKMDLWSSNFLSPTHQPGSDKKPCIMMCRVFFIPVPSHCGILQNQRIYWLKKGTPRIKKFDIVFPGTNRLCLSIVSGHLLICGGGGEAPSSRILIRVCP
jgi:hypothetical protein